MGGPSYQEPYPIDTPEGKKIWSWGTKSWGDYTAPPTTTTPPAPGTPDSDSTGGRSNAPDQSFGGPSNPGGAENYQVPKGTRPIRRRGGTRGAMPGASLLLE
jgi:hypothetical protein